MGAPSDWAKLTDLNKTPKGSDDHVSERLFNYENIVKKINQRKKQIGPSISSRNTPEPNIISSVHFERFNWQDHFLSTMEQLEASAEDLEGHKETASEYRLRQNEELDLIIEGGLPLHLRGKAKDRRGTSKYDMVEFSILQFLEKIKTDDSSIKIYKNRPRRYLAS